MIRKLFSYVRDECKAEDQDAPSMHELLLPGHVYLALLSVCISIRKKKFYLVNFFFSRNDWKHG
jgi:hypothetical protein